MFKSSKSIIGESLKKEIPVEEFITQKIAGIDGNQTVKRYKKLELLGKGGFANCFITENVQTKRRAATKIIQKQVLTSQKTKLRLLNEIRLHKTLHHENVVEFYHYFEDKSNVYIFLELCENQSLNQLIKIRQTFSTPEIQSFMLGIINGLKYLHAKGIIHRDLKLGNIFLDKRFNIKLGDFGLATKLEFRKQCKRTICGTPNYIAPEILQGKGYHFEVDIWALGVILYTLYYTIPPFETEQAATTYQKIKKCQYTIPKYGNVPLEAVDLMQKILVKNSWERLTLDEIVESDFMKLGNRIYKELPGVCSKKAPVKKDFENINYWTYDEMVTLNKRNNQPQCQNSSFVGNQLVEFISVFESIGDGKYFYILSSGMACIFASSEIVFKDQYGVIKLFDPNDVRKGMVDCGDNPLKYLLSCQLKVKAAEKDSYGQAVQGIRHLEKERLLEETLFPAAQIPLHVKKISPQLKHNFYMVRLSNHTIQMIFDDNSSYLIDGNGSEIYEIKNNKVQFTYVLKQKYQLSSEQMAQIGLKRAKYVLGILGQIKVLKEKKQIKVEKKQSQQVEETPKFFTEELNKDT